MLQLPSSLLSAAILLGASVSHHPAGVVVQFHSFDSFASFASLAASSGIPHFVALNAGVYSVAFGALPAGGL